MYTKYIRGTPRGDLVVKSEAFVSNVRTSVRKTFNANSSKVYITARSLKHIYERLYLDLERPEIFSMVIQSMPKIMTYPDKICKNKPNKPGEYCFIKKIDGQVYLCSVEIVEGKFYVVTGFIPHKESYYNKLEVVWSF